MGLTAVRGVSGFNEDDEDELQLGIKWVLHNNEEGEEEEGDTRGDFDSAV